MQYKALMLDLDGTVIPNRKDGMPSIKVAQAINKAAKLLHVGIATSRPYFIAAHILDRLQLSGPSILHGGAQIMDATSRQIIRQKFIQKEDVQAIYQITKKFKLKVEIDLETKSIAMPIDWQSRDLLGAFVADVNLDVIDRFVLELSQISSLAAHKIPGWKKGTIGVSISHALATKQHGILEVAKLLNIQPQEIIGVGDGYNDFPLLMACGLKVAMGNAVDEIKAIADYIAPSVEDDGVAKVIEKFIL